MSSIANFYLLPKGALAALKEANASFEFCETHGKRILQFDWSGYAVVMAIVYLQECESIDFLADKEMGVTATLLSQATEATCLLLTAEHKTLLPKLDASRFSEATLHKYYAQFNDSEYADCGKAMLDGIAALKRAIELVDDESMVLVVVG